MAIASAICTAMIGFGFFARRGDRSRRWLFVVAGILCSAMTAITIVANEQVSYRYRNGYDPIIESIIAAAVLLPAVLLIVFGWKGRRIGGHPHCRNCGFDLFGKPPESTRCGECGADLAGAKSVVLGVWSPRRWPVLVGLFMLILGLMLGGEAGREYTTGIDWYHWLPTWWLLRELDSPSNHRRAADVLSNEMMTSDLSPAHARLIEEKVLNDMEAGRTDELYFRLLVLVGQRDLLDEATTRRTLRQIAQLGSLAVRTATTERGRPIILFDWLASYFGLQNLTWHLAPSSCRVGGFPVPASRVTPVPTSPRESLAWDAVSIDLGDDWSKIPPGNVTISRDVVLTVTLHYRGKLLVETSRTTLQCVSRVVEPRKTTQ